MINWPLTILCLAIIWWSAFWAIAKITQYEESTEYTAVFLTKRNKLVRLVLFMLWPFISPLAFVILTIAQILRG
jgi:hypothetical protein